MNKLKNLQRATLGGSLLAALTASLCCLGPLVAVALGAGSFAASTAFERWRPALLGLTLGLLALAWYLTYRKPRAACGEGAVCATKPVAKYNPAILWIATVAVLITAAFPDLSSLMLQSSQSSPAATVADGHSAIVKVRIPSMDCTACAVSIQKKLRQQAGVVTASVHYDTKEAVVQYDVTRVSPETIISVIDATGFNAEPTRR
jgi:copper chaperone CopZ